MSTDAGRFLSTVLRRVILPLALLTAVMIGLGLLVTKSLVHTWPFTVEDQVNRTLFADRNPAWDTVTNAICILSNTPLIIAVSALVAGVMWLVYRRWREPLFIITVVSASSLVFLLTTLVIGRQRPAVPHLDVSPPTSSFPSGHVASSLALYGGLALVLTLHARRKASKARWWLVLFAIPVAVAISRLYRGMHHPSDVIASFVVGLSCLWMMRRAILQPATEPSAAVHARGVSEEM
jgi:membrane-associated phospholipid phosphatase